MLVVLPSVLVHHQEQDYKYGGGVSLLFESGSYVRVVGKLGNHLQNQ